MDRLRQNYASHVGAFDSDGDGKVSASELLSVGDTDGDGKLDAKELQTVAERFSEQIKYSNMLLEQIQNFEEKALASQKEIQEKQQALRQALSVCDAAKEEANEYKRKLAVQTEVAANMSEQCKDARLEASARKRELDALRRTGESSKGELVGLKEEREHLTTQLEQQRLRNAELQTEINNTKTEAAAREAAATAAAEGTAQELDDLKRKNGPLVEQVKGLQESYTKIKEALQDKEADMATITAQRDQEAQKVATLEAALNEQRSALAARDESVGAGELRANKLEAELQAQKDLYDKQSAELRVVQDREAKTTQGLAGLREENAEIKQELEGLLTESLAITQARAQDQKRWEKKLGAAEDELASVLRSSQEKEQSHTLALQRKNEEAAASRKAHEEQYTGLQSEHTELHRLLQKMQVDSNKQIEQFEDERKESEAQLAQLRSALNMEEASQQDTSSRAGATESQLKQQVLQLQRTLAERSEQYLGILTDVKGAVDEMKEEAVEAKESQSVLAAEYAKLKVRVSEVSDKTGEPLGVWHSEVGRAMSKLVEQSSRMRSREKEVRDQLRGVNSRYEEEKSKKIMLEETVSDLEHQLAASIGNMQKEQEKSQNALGTARREQTELAANATELESRANFLQSNLTEQQKRASELQVENQRLQAAINEQKTVGASQTKKLEAKLEELQKQAKAASRERDQLATKDSEMQRSLKETGEALQQRIAKVSELEALLDEAQDVSRSAVGQYQKRIAAMAEGQEALQEQMQKKTRLLDTVQQQREVLQQDNISLRAELDAAYKKTLERGAGGTAGGSAASMSSPLSKLRMDLQALVPDE